MSEVGEYQMVLGLKNGNIKCYELLFQQKYNTFYSFIKGFVKDEWVAEDIVQNIFMKVWINRESLNPELSIHSYLFVLAKNEVYNHFRSKLNLLQLKEINVNDAVYDDLESSYNAKEIVEKVAKVVAEMPLQRREIYRLSRINHLTNKEIAEQLNLSVRTVEKHIELALRDLRKYLGAFQFFLFILFM